MDYSAGCDCDYRRPSCHSEVYLITTVIASGLAIALGHDKWLTWLIFLQRFAYRQVMYWVVVRSVFAALRGRLVGWGKLERKATVELETAISRP